MTDEIFKRLSAPFPTEQISWRPGAMNGDKTSALGLAYIDARDVMDRLDDVVGPTCWQCRYTSNSLTTVCEIGIRFPFADDELKESIPEWVWKADGAGASDIEAEKGALSDAFKRAAVRWGIGRYLYGMGAKWAPVQGKRFTDEGHDILSKFHADFIKKLEWGGETEGPVVGKIVRFLKEVITLTCKQKSDAMEFLSKNEGLINTLPAAAQKSVNDALRPLMEM